MKSEISDVNNNDPKEDMPSLQVQPNLVYSLGGLQTPGSRSRSLSPRLISANVKREVSPSRPTSEMVRLIADGSPKSWRRSRRSVSCQPEQPGDEAFLEEIVRLGDDFMVRVIEASNTMGPSEEGTSEKKSSAVCIGLPDGEEALFGMHIETLTLDCRYCHTISQVHEQGEAKVIGLKDGDELLVLNGTCMIDVPHDDLLSTFCSLLNGNSSRDLMVVVRRPVEQNGEDDDCIDYEYIKITAAIQVLDVPDGREDEVDGLPLFLAKLKASLWKTITIQLKSQGNGVESYIFGGSSETKNCHICYKSGELIVHRGECPDPECQALFRIYSFSGVGPDTYIIISLFSGATLKTLYTRDEKLKFRKEKSNPAKADSAPIDKVFKKHKFHGDIVFGYECYSKPGQFLSFGESAVYLSEFQPKDFVNHEEAHLCLRRLNDI